ncbi:MAG: O-antigen ligase family protein [Ardenticatenaceae bacterium]
MNINSPLHDNSTTNSKNTTLTSKKRPVGALLIECLLIALAAPLLFFSTASALGGIFLIIVAWIGRRRAYGYWRLATPADPALALFWLTALLALVVSVDWRLSIYLAKILLLGWLVYEFTVVAVAEVGLNQRFFTIAGLGALLVTAMCLTITNLARGILVPIPELYQHLPEIITAGKSGSLFNPRAIAAFAVLLWPINALLAVGAIPDVARVPLWQRLLHSLAALLLIGVILLTQSPQGLLALGAALLVFFLWHDDGEIRTPSRGEVIRVLLVLILPFLGGLLLLPYLPNSLFATLFSGRAGFSMVARLELWVRAWHMIQSAPLTGIGLNNYSYVMNTLYPGYALGPEEHAHQLYLQTLTDQGILGLFALLLLFGVTLWTAIRLIRLESDPFLKQLLVAVIATIAGWLAFGLLEVQEEASILVWFILALPMGLARRKKALTAPSASPTPLSGRTSLKLLLFEASVALLLLIFFWQNGTLHLNMATITAQQTLSDHATLGHDTTTALERLEQAEKRMGPQPHLYRLRALLHVERKQNKAAARTFRELVALELNKPLWWWAPAANLSGELSEEERAAAQISIYRHWYVRYPDRLEPVVLMGYTYADTQDEKRIAISFLKHNLSNGQLESGNGPVLEAILAELSE